MILLTQERLSQLSRLKQQCQDYNSAASIRVEDISLAIAYTEPPNASTAAHFADFIANLAWYGETSHGCDKIVSAGGVSVIARLLARWPEVEDVVFQACDALRCLVNFDSEAVRCVVRNVPNIASMLRDASTRLQAWNKSDHAADALALLQL